MAKLTKSSNELTPDSFKMPLVEEAYRLRRWALARSATHKLDPATSLWIVRMEAWLDFKASADFLTMVQIGPTRRNELLGLPVRITIDDAPDVPMIQLVMEPKIAPR